MMPATTLTLPSRSPAELAPEFHRLAAEWRQKSAHLSNSMDMAMLPEYQRIVAMGPAVVGLILEELETKPDFWFRALEALTGEDPIPGPARGKVRQMADAWVKWGHERGLLA
jgi:hypothetical protein